MRRLDECESDDLQLTRATGSPSSAGTKLRVSSFAQRFTTDCGTASDSPRIISRGLFQLRGGIGLSWADVSSAYTAAKTERIPFFLPLEQVIFLRHFFNEIVMGESTLTGEECLKSLKMCKEQHVSKVESCRRNDLPLAPLKWVRFSNVAQSIQLNQFCADLAAPYRTAQPAVQQRNTARNDSSDTHSMTKESPSFNMVGRTITVTVLWPRKFFVLYGEAHRGWNACGPLISLLSGCRSFLSNNFALLAYARALFLSDMQRW